MPRVSVVIAAYNASSYIERALDSILAQTVIDWEVLVVDDCSTDNTCAVVSRRAAEDSRIHLLVSDRNSGPSGARNRAIDAARGDWIAVLDADDRWRPNRLERMLAEVKNQSAVIIADNYIPYDEGTDQELDPVLSITKGTSLLTARRFLDSERPFVTVRFGLLKPIVSRSFLNMHMIRYPVEIRYAEDFHFFMQILLAGGKGLLMHEPLYIYTLPQSMMSNTVSGGSRTIPRHGDRIWIANSLLKLCGDEAPQATLSAVRRYQQSMTTLGEGYRIHDIWRSGRRSKAFIQAATRPVAVVAYGITLPKAKRMRARIGRFFKRLYN